MNKSHVATCKDIGKALIITTSFGIMVGFMEEHTEMNSFMWLCGSSCANPWNFGRSLIRSASNLKYFVLQWWHWKPTSWLFHYPMKHILQKPKLPRCMTKWSVELSKFGPTYQNRRPMKSKFLVDFLTELLPKREQFVQWFFNADKFSNKKGSGVSIILEGSNDLVLK